MHYPHYAKHVDSRYVICIIWGMPTCDEIKAARRRLGETQAAFAKRFGVDQATIHRWEKDGLPRRGAAQVAVENLLTELRKAPQPEAAAG